MKKPILFMKLAAFCLLFPVIVLVSGCSDPSQRVMEIKRFPVDDLDGIITRSGAELDKDNSSDGKGSLRVISNNPATVRLFEVRDIEVENAVLTYHAKVRSKDLKGQAYLEMRCHFKDREARITTDTQASLTGTTEWMTMRTACSVAKGEMPEVIKLNLVINGTGVVWIDDVRLLKGPFRQKSAH